MLNAMLFSLIWLFHCFSIIEGNHWLGFPFGIMTGEWFALGKSDFRKHWSFYTMYVVPFQLCFYYWSAAKIMTIWLTIILIFCLLYGNRLGCDCSYVYHQCYSCWGLQKIHIGLSYSPWTGMLCISNLHCIVNYECMDQLIFNFEAVILKGE